MVSTPVASAAGKRTRWAGWIGNAAFGWSLLFAAAHVYLAFGGTVLLGGTPGRSAGVLFAQEPCTYSTGWTILSLLFAFAGLFPVALAWSGKKRTSRSGMKTGAVSLAYAGMVLLALFGLAAREFGLFLLGVGVCILGLGFAIVRPRGRPFAAWTVLIVTWGLGVAMTFYGCVYLVAAIGEIHSELFLVYLIAGGVSWFSGGALFLATAWLATRRKASRTRPASFVAKSVRLRSCKSGSPQENTDIVGNRSACLRAERRTS